MKRNDLGVRKFVALAICVVTFPAAMACAESFASAVPASLVRDDSLSDADLRWMDELNDDGELDSPYTWPEVGTGSKDAPLVRAVQYLLRAHGYKLAVDGKFGTQTGNRVKQFKIKFLNKGHGAEEYITIYKGLGSDDWAWESLIVPIRRNSKKSNAVRAAQSLLRAKGYEIPLDGKFGTATYNAVRRFQDAHKLTVDGIVGTQTWCVLLGGKFYDYNDPNGATRE